jgi:hypothetical protein
VGHHSTNDEAQKVVDTALSVAFTHILLVAMDPNAEERPPTAQIAEVDIDITTEVCYFWPITGETDGLGSSCTSFR